MVVHRQIAPVVLDILSKLYEASYPIERMVLIDDYGADDEKSMTDNNSSGFNFRFISHTSTISQHGLGLAVDINPLYNPYVKKIDGMIKIEPLAGKDYINRQNNFPYKITAGDLCHKLFTAAGFVWGGDWLDRKDYQHFAMAWP